MPRKPSEDKMLSRRVLVNIKRDQTAAIPRVIWQHEKPILEELFGEGNVVEVDVSTLDEGYSAKPAPELLIHNKKQDAILPPSETAGIGYVFIGSPQVEFQRLISAYGMHPTIQSSTAEHVYGRFQEGRFAGVIGFPSVADLPDAQLRSLALEFGVEPADVKQADQEKLRKIVDEVGALA